jgi:hypothetical protein
MIPISMFSFAVIATVVIVAVGVSGSILIVKGFGLLLYRLNAFTSWSVT